MLLSTMVTLVLIQCFVSGLQAHDQDDNRKGIEEILVYNAQMSCANDKALTTINLNFSYTPVMKFPSVDMIISVPLSINQHILESRSIDTFAFASRDFGIGMGNGTARAVLWQNHRRESIFIPRTHPIHNRSNCVRIAGMAAEKPTNFYTDRTLFQTGSYQYLGIFHNVLLQKYGIIGLKCGWIQQRKGCANKFLQRGKPWWKGLHQRIDKSGSDVVNPWNDAMTISTALNHTLPIIDEVFVIDTQWDFNYHHWMLQAAPRLIRFLKMLRENKHIKIHILKEEDHMIFSRGRQRIYDCAIWLRKQVFALLGLDASRLVSGSYIARKVYLPREMECAFFLKHNLELKMFADTMKVSASAYQCEPNIMYYAKKKHKKGRKSVKAEMILLQDRQCTPDALTWRCLSGGKLRELALRLHDAFPNYDIETTQEIGDYNLTGVRPLACTIQQYARADITIGVHGAAMANIMFLRPDSIMIEIVGEFDGRMMPVCGLHGPLAAAFDVHSYIYYFDGLLPNATINVDTLVKEFDVFYKFLRSQKNAREETKRNKFLLK
jgi:hypothetical protein